MTIEPFDRIVRPASVITWHSEANPRAVDDVFARIQWSGSRLSVTGVEGPKPYGDAWGGCGQIVMHARDHVGGWLPAGDFTEAQMHRFIELWDRWHLNDMRAGCEHQRAEKWDERPIDPSKPLNSYGKHFEGQSRDSWNMLSWVRPTEHPDGLLYVPCPTCGHRFGTGWLTEEVPDEVLLELLAFPESGKTPAWV